MRIPPSEHRRPLAFAHGNVKNYRFAELDADSWTALQELVDAGFVQRFSSEREVVAYLRGEKPGSSKLALVKNDKDGVVKCRLVLDCRVSGTNDAAVKVERTRLPKCLDVVRDIMSLKKKQRRRRPRRPLCTRLSGCLLYDPAHG